MRMVRTMATAKKELPHCGLCQMKVKDWKIHTEGALHRKNLERASKGEFGLVMGGVANAQLLEESGKRMDEAFNELKKGMTGEETLEIVKKGRNVGRIEEASNNGVPKDIHL